MIGISIAFVLLFISTPLLIFTATPTEEGKKALDFSLIIVGVLNIINILLMVLGVY